MKKLIFLLSILAIPVLVFVFLRFFGDNTFEVEKFYQDGDLILNECKNVEIPYKVDFNSVKASAGDKKIMAIAFATDPCKPEDLKQKLYHLGRIKESLDGQIHNFIVLKDCEIPDNIWDDISVNKYEFQVAKLSHLSLSELNCLFLLNEGRLIQDDLSGIDLFHMMVLLDHEGIIRGYYDGLSTKDTDRLLLESRILLK